MDIREDDLSSADARGLLATHLAYCRTTSPPESTHALDLDALRAPHVTCWTAWRDEGIAGVGALAEIAPGHGEIKSMHTAAAHRRAGVADAIVAHILDVARDRGYARVSLETGSQDAFAPARALYARHGFSYCDPFGSYVLDPNSVFMTLAFSREAIAP